MNNKVKIIICAVACVLVLFLGAIGLFKAGVFSGINNSDTNASGDQLSPDFSETNKKAKPNVGEDGVIKTPYCDLIFDTAFIDYLYVVHNDETPYTVKFYAILDNRPEQRLFDITFGESKNETVVTIYSDGKKIPVSTVVYAFVPDDSWSDDEINTILAMQEVLNELIGQLGEVQLETEASQIKQEDVDETEPTEKADKNSDKKTDTKTEFEACTDIKTPYCTLKFPEEWKDYLKVEHIDSDVYTVKFYADLDNRKPVLMFSIIFGGDDGEQLGAVKSTNGEIVSVNLVFESLDNVNYSEKEMKIIREMQDGVNTLIDQIPFV